MKGRLPKGCEDDNGWNFFFEGERRCEEEKKEKREERYGY